MFGLWKRGPSERELLMEALQLVREAQAAQQATMQQWLGMFSAASQARPAGWVADDESLGIREEAKERGIVLPEALQSGSEEEKVQWLAAQMDDPGW